MGRASLVGLVMLILVAGCGGGDTTPTGTSEPGAPSTQSPSTHSPVTSTSTIGNGRVVAENGRIAYLADYDTRQGSERYDVYTVTPEGSARHRLTRSGDVHALTWSPDGKRIAYIRQGPSAHTRIWAIDEDGLGQEPLSRPSDSEASLDWSPDGSQIAVSGFDGRLSVLDVHTGISRPLVPKLPRRWTIFADPRWSAEGHHLAVEAFKRGPDHDEFGDPALHSALFIIDVDTGAGRKIAGTSHMLGYDWSRANGQIVYGNGEAFGPPDVCSGDIYISDPQESHPQLLVKMPCRQHDPVWSPDGLSFAFVSGNELGRGLALWVADRRGNHRHLIVPPPGSSRRPQDVAWQPLP